ncbi:MAG: type II toxin-antitoxin system VapB family antitoxin [Coxiellaceae bacterium]|nr:type II toxin-antitoxin system VapB family antitoxin [Coxiellaceae bacterium]
MRTTKVFKSGNSMAVRLPKDCQLTGDTVEIIKKGNTLILREIPPNLAKAFEIMEHMPADYFTTGRQQSAPQERGSFE